MRLRISTLFPLPSIQLQLSKFGKLHCYIYLLIWIVLFSSVLYWFLITNYVQSPTSTSSEEGLLKRPVITFDDFDQDKSATKDDTLASGIEGTKSRTFSIPNDERYLRPFDAHNSLATFLPLRPTTTPERVCNFPGSIKTGDENLETPDYKLYAVIVLIRHGDRGPLTHVGHHNITSINCQPLDSTNTEQHPDLKNLLKFSEGISKQPGYLHFIGAFHSFPKVPMSHACHLGQLTQLGSVQQVQLGRLLRKTYHSSLFHDLPLRNNNNAVKIIAYSTRYRRTLQSLISFLYGLLGPKHVVPNVTIRESQSITFCFNDCSCKLVERLKKISARNYQSLPEDKLEMTNLVNKLNSILGITKNKRAGAALLDLLLVYTCHNASLPCHSRSTSAYRPAEEFRQESPKPPECITAKDVTTLINLIQRETSPLTSNYHFALLSAYGLLKEIINLALKMSTTSEAGGGGGDTSAGADTAEGNLNQRKSSRIAIFSGHDTTLQSLLGALGIFGSHPDLRLPPYASRFVFEFYTKVRGVALEDSARKYHFRALYNGISVTHLISFCRDAFSGGAAGAEREFFCPLENLVRFIHDHYFESFGNTTTNFRDACQYLKQPKPQPQF